MDLSLTQDVLTVISEIFPGFLLGDLLGGRTPPSSAATGGVHVISANKREGAWFPKGN